MHFKLLGRLTEVETIASGSSIRELSLSGHPNPANDGHLKTGQ
jgi:hypothetical protein